MPRLYTRRLRINAFDSPTATSSLRKIKVGNDGIPNSFTDVVSKSSDLLLQFDPPANAWLFLLSLPVIGHTNSNKRQDGNFQIAFALFTSMVWPVDDHIVKYCGTSFKSHYSVEMLKSLGYVFTDKYLKSKIIQNSFLTIEKRSIDEFYDYCCLIRRSLRENHCFHLDDLIMSNIMNKNEASSTLIDMKPSNDCFFLIQSIILTPMRIILNPLNKEIGNRALRLRGVKNYIRVYIRDENEEMLDKLDSYVRLRVKQKMLTDGLLCMNRIYYCVGSSTSQRKNFSYWFTTLYDGETIDQVRAQFGDFTAIKNLATYVARVGQYFSTSSPTGIRLNYIDTKAVRIRIPESGQSELISSSDGFLMRILSWIKPTTMKNELQQKYTVFIIRDIKENNYCFTDGCGFISLGLAQEVSEKIGLSVKQLSDIPSAFQIRMGGCKGMLAIDPESNDNDYYIKVRDSMMKFSSNDWTLDICDYSRPMFLSLNNQIIRLLSDLGNEIAVFESLQYRMSKPALWHAPENACLNVFDSELAHHQQSRYLNA
ncbi:unnamed protein product [Rotaria sp. Silwood2]|nr:unnamed protein product [Rotaria sp. Silwood2]CAF3091104.1 unnamed protein product [Rotaria sp. Silwood2]CAF4218573.1 unnamed protein product [Rotaria sp. Silwood2]CAF4321887.1 unnamed protein product [Rotaria sp. Silwood2]